MWTVRGNMAWTLAVLTNQFLIVFEQAAIENVMPRAFAYLAHTRVPRTCRTC